MNDAMIRVGLYIERFSTSFAMGIFFILPLHFKTLGWDETFFGQVYAVGALGTILSIVLSAQLMRKLGFSKIAPMGSLLYTIGCLCYFLSDYYHSVQGYYLASLLQGAGWGLTFTVGPIGIASTLSEKSNVDRAYYFTVHSAYTALGAGTSSFVIRYFPTYFNWSVQHLFILATLACAMAYLVAARVAMNNAAYCNVRTSNLSGISEFVTVLKQPSVYFFGMIFFGGCIYTAVISLQITFAAIKKIDYIIFYSFYALAIVGARFAFSKSLSRIPPKTSIPFLVSMLTVGVGFLLLAEYSMIAYALSALFLGAGYGLAYSIVQAEAIHYVPPSLRPTVLVYFSLSYFLGVYLFPYFAAIMVTIFSYETLWLALIVLGIAYLLTAVYFYKVTLKKLEQTFE